jgi:hypothetical protein
VTEAVDRHDFRMGAEYISTPIGDVWSRKLTGYYLFHCTTCGAGSSGDKEMVQSAMDDHIVKHGPPAPEACVDTV